MLLLLSEDISLNRGPINGSQKYNNDQWDVFKKRVLHFVHININSFLPKIDKLQYIAKLSEAAVLAISESKLDDSVQSYEILIEIYDLIRSDRTGHGGGVACFIRNNLSYNTKSFLPWDRKNIHRDFLPHSKALIVGTIYRPPNQDSFTETITEYFAKINTNEVYVIGIKYIF